MTKRIHDPRREKAGTILLDVANDILVASGAYKSADVEPRFFDTVRTKFYNERSKRWSTESPRSLKISNLFAALVTATKFDDEFYIASHGFVGAGGEALQEDGVNLDARVEICAGCSGPLKVGDASMLPFLEICRRHVPHWMSAEVKDKHTWQVFDAEVFRSLHYPSFPSSTNFYLAWAGFYALFAGASDSEHLIHTNFRLYNGPKYCFACHEELEWLFENTQFAKASVRAVESFFEVATELMEKVARDQDKLVAAKKRDVKKAGVKNIKKHFGRV